MNTRINAPKAALGQNPQSDASGSALRLLSTAIGKTQGSSKRGGKASGMRGDRIQRLKTDLRELETSHGAQDTTFMVVCSRLGFYPEITDGCERVESF